jgi:hypothetical protein
VKRCRTTRPPELERLLETLQIEYWEWMIITLLGSRPKNDEEFFDMLRKNGSFEEGE